MVPLMAARWCTKDWKAKPLERWAADNGNPDILLGIDAGEAHRAQDHTRPLVDEGIDRTGCLLIIAQANLLSPGKSGCWLCPFMPRARWERLYATHNDLFERAARLEEIASERTGRHITLDPSGVITLRQRQAMYEGQVPMFDEQTMDGLRTFQPCVCGL